jgi:hypothetical protein
MTYTQQDRERFWARVDRLGPLACWSWLGSHHEFGYGWFWAQGKSRNAHRVAWELTFGPIPNGLQVMHSCDNGSCVNPAHLMIGTNAANQMDMARKGRSTKGRFVGELHPGAKLTTDDVHEIRRRVAAGEVYRTIAADFGVTESTISVVGRGLSWESIA